MKRDTHLNIIGPEIRRIRKQRGWSQSKLALHLQSVGWNISRSGLDSGLAVHQSRPYNAPGGMEWEPAPDIK